MLIVCPSCATSYNVQPNNLGASGRSVRCARCEKVWHAELPQALKLVSAAEAIAPAAPASVAPPAAEAPSGLVWAEHPGESQWDTADAAQDRPVDDARTADPAQAQPFPEPHDADAPDGLPTMADGAAPPLAPVDLDEGRPVIAEAPAKPLDVESFAARRTRRAQERRRLRWPLSRLQTAILALIVVDSVLIGWRNDVVRLLPQTASFYSLIGLPVNLRGLSFDAIDIVKEQHEGVPVLVVQGNIVNESRRAVEVPRLKFAVRNASGQEIYSWTAVPPRTVLPGREAVGFRSRLASPPPEGRDVLVRFLNRRDVVAGVR